MPNLLCQFHLIGVHHVLSPIFVIGNHHDRYVFLIVKAQLFRAALPYWNPCLVWDPSATHPFHSYVITLFADATVIPFTLSADTTITS